MKSELENKFDKDKAVMEQQLNDLVRENKRVLSEKDMMEERI